MIHVLDFDDNIIDFISNKDNYLLSASMSRNNDDDTDTFDFTIDSDRAYNMRERYRIITPDRNGIQREYIIVNISDDFEDVTTIQANASYVEDITTARPYAPGSFTKYTTTQALSDVLKDTGWEVSEETEYGGIRSTSWTSYQTRYEVAKQLETTFDMELDFYIELGANTVEHRYVSLKAHNSLFKGKEITYGKDLTGMTRTVDLTAVHTALLAVGPEDENGARKEVVVTDDDAQSQFGLQGRYIWGVYEPESDDQNMTVERLTTLAHTQLNKDKQAAIAYEVSSADISHQFPHEKVDLGDTVRIKDREFNPPLYIEAEVVSEVYDSVANESTFTFGKVVQYKESELRQDLYDRLADIRKKMDDNITNINTIVQETVDGQMEYYERKIIKSATPPDNPVNDMLWYDTSNPEVAVIRRYRDGQWVEETASDVEQIGGVTREKALYSELTNAFTNLAIHHAQMQSQMFELLNSEYLVDTDVKNKLNDAYGQTVDVFNQIKNSLDSMTPETATIGKLIDTQAMFLTYREKLQALYNAASNAQRSIDTRFKLLQSQYTDEKFNDAMEQVASNLPNGRWDSENLQLSSDIPNQQQLDELRQSLQAYSDGNTDAIKDEIGKSVNAQLKATQDEINASVQSVDKKVDNLAQDTDTKLNPLTARVTTTESNIQILQDGLKLSATKDDVQQTLDDALTPIKSQVKSQQATLDVLPSQIASKVSQSDYDTDKDNIVQRLNSADSERTQLSNSINDRVTLSEYTNGQAQTKQDIQNAVDDIEVGTRNLIKNSDFIQGKTFWRNVGDTSVENNVIEDTSGNLPGNFKDYIMYTATATDEIKGVAQDLIDVEVGKEYILSAWVKCLDGDNRVAFYAGNKSATFKEFQTTNDWQRYEYKFTATETPINVYFEKRKSIPNSTIAITGVQLVRGNTNSDYKPSDKDTEQRLTTMQTNIEQNGKDIKLRATQEEFNANKKTLSKTISDITVNTMSGITLSYDENGAITTETVDKNGVKIRGDRVDITVNKDFNVVASRVDDKVGKSEVVNRLNLSNEGLDINVNKIGIHGGDASTRYVDIRNDSIELGGVVATDWRGTKQTAKIFTRMKDGHLRFRNNDNNASLYFSYYGISTYMDGEGENGGSSGTIAWWDPSYSPSGANGITINSYGGVAALTSGLNRTMVQSRASVNLESLKSGIYLRPQKSEVGNSTFAFTSSTGETSNANVKGYLMFGDLVDDDTWKYYSGLRFYKGRNYIEVVDGNFAAGGNTVIDTGNLMTNSIFKRNGSTTAYWNGTSTGTINDGALPLDNQLVATSMVTNRGDKTMYIGTRSGGEVRITNEYGYNSGSGITYRDIRVNDVYADTVNYKTLKQVSSVDIKTDITEWNYDALNVITNELQTYQYKYKNEDDRDIYKKDLYHRGLIVGRDYKTPDEFIAGEGVDIYEIVTWQLRAIQQLNDKVEEQNNKIKELEALKNG